MTVAVVTGGASGLGRLIVDVLRNTEAYSQIEIWDTQTTDPVNVWASDAHRAGNQLQQCDLLVNCAGRNELRSFRNVSLPQFEEHMRTNAYAMANCTQALLPLLRASRGTVCNIISNASHMPMRHSLAYNASKAAAAMVTRQMARELGDEGLTVFGVSPNRLRGTPMSDSVDRQVAAIRSASMAEVKQKQREAMAIGEETDPFVVAEFIGFLLSNKNRHKYLHGAILEYGI